jgi:hypothetical protein
MTIACRDFFQNAAVLATVLPGDYANLQGRTEVFEHATVRVDSGLDGVIDGSATLEIILGEAGFFEVPLWIAHDGKEHLILTEIAARTFGKLERDGSVSVIASPPSCMVA